MLQAYQGYFQEGVRFIADNAIVKIPPNKRIIINVLDEIVDMEAESNEQEISERLKMLESITGIIHSDVDEKVIRAERIAKRGLL
jgi:hypothetical protein